MDGLPLETLHNVVRCCDYRTQKRLRSACRDLSDVASEYVFETVFLSLLSISVENVRKIANHRKFARHVRTIIFCPQLIPRYRTSKDWKAHLNSRTYPKLPLRHGFVFADPLSFALDLEASELAEWAEWAFEDDDGENISVEQWIELPERVLNPRESLRAFRRSVNLFQDQLHWIRDGFTKEMRELIRKFPNLENAEVPSCHTHRSLPLWRSLRSELLQTPAEWMMTSESIVEEWGVEQLASLLEATALEGRPMKTLKFDVDPTAFLSQKNGSRLPDSAYGQADDRAFRMAGAFTNLRDLDADFDHHREEVDEAVAIRFASFLKAAKQLRKLTLTLTQSICHHGIKAGVDILDYLKPVHLPMLTELVMANMRTSEDNLLGILSTHTTTLKHLSLKRINLNYANGTWTSIIRQMPTVLSLDHVFLGSLGEIAKPHGQCFHIESFYHFFDCDGPGWDEYYEAVVSWILDGPEEIEDEYDFPILSASEWDEIFPENPALSTYSSYDLDSDEGSDVL